MGVKSLWTLLSPVGRPVLLETMEGKTMAIDSSIWIYQFQATMRDKEGKGFVNAHVLGFLRRITKLLFYGIKPVFVFDGGAPALKRSTLNERKKKKSGAALSHAKLAERILAAQMRREAINHAQAGSSRKKRESDSNTLDEHTVYLEDIDGSVPKTPPAKRAPSTPSSAKKDKFRDHDPYRLPDVDVDKVVAQVTSSVAPDPRLATEDELRTFIEEMRPDDFDITSPAFRDLPTEVQYEIVGDLRLKSRQTSYARLQNMLKNSQTPLDFSKQQIKNLQKRNALTQQLLVTTDTIGSSHLAIPVRIASERNKEYVLMKNEGAEGGWILGIKDIGTAEKPIVIDHDDDGSAEEVGSESDDDMEEVDIPTQPTPDPDLREYQREMALSGIASRNAAKKPIPRPINRKGKLGHIFGGNDHEDNTTFAPTFGDEDEVDDDMLAFAIQESFDQSLQKHSSHPERRGRDETSPDIDDDFVPPTRLQTQLSIGNVTPSKPISNPSTPGRVHSRTSSHSTPTPSRTRMPVSVQPTASSESDEDMEAVALSQPTFRADSPTPVTTSKRPVSPLQLNPRITSPDTTAVTIESQPSHPEPSSMFSFGKSTLTLDDESAPQERRFIDLTETDPSPMKRKVVTFKEASLPPVSGSETRSPPEVISLGDSDEDMEMEEVDIPPAALPSPAPHTPPPEPTTSRDEELIDNLGQPLFTMSRSPSPTNEGEAVLRAASPTLDADWDAAQEMDIQAEEREFAQFISQVKGRNLDAVRREIDEELRVLNQQRKAALRDSEDITQQMITQIMTMLRLFGIPYITAPMEAEAQCAELVTLGLVDGVITDDSDVFLFGAQRVYKNMFNQSKTVECFVASDLQRELGLDRETLIQLAYLLGSDYTEGLPGVGPVMAMELLKEFRGENALFKFREWWSKVQTGKDKPEESASKFRRRFKKRFKDLYLSSDWPNSVVRDAYYHPTVDHSDEPFKWALPDLDGLRQFLQQELGWKADKVDELLLPIIQKMNKRKQIDALNKQGNLNEFFDISAGGGAWAPRQRQPYSSKRLQQVISDFRKRQKSVDSSSADGRSRSQSADGEDGDEDGGKGKKPARKRARVAGPSAPRKRTAKGKEKAVTPRPAGATTTKKKGARRGKAKEVSSDEDDEDMMSVTGIDGGESGGEIDGRNTVDDEDSVRRVAELNLRPRPKPRPIHKAPGSKVPEEGTSASVENTGQ